MKKLLLLTSLIAFACTSCSVHFTSALRKQLEDSNVAMNRVQFYNSQSFALQRELSSTETEIEGGKIQIKEGKRIEIINIPKSTPAVATHTGIDTIFVRFEEGDNKGIPFTCNRMNNVYSLITPEKEREPLDVKDYADVPNCKFYGILNYDSKEYYYGYDIKPRLKVKKKQMEKVLTEERTLDGVKIE